MSRLVPLTLPAVILTVVAVAAALASVEEEAEVDADLQVSGARVGLAAKSKASKK